jgi:hypothetical protein
MGNSHRDFESEKWELLKRLARLARYQENNGVLLSRLAKKVSLQPTGVSSNGFITQSIGDPFYCQYEGKRPNQFSYEDNCQFVYQLNSLFHEGLIANRMMIVHDKRNMSCGLGDDSIVITRKGLDKVGDLERSWFSKAIDKQPVTFLQIITTVLSSIVGGIVGYLIGAT